MKKAIAVLILCLMIFKLKANERIDEYPGLFEIKVGEHFSRVQHLFGSVKEKDVSNGKEYYSLIDPQESEYSEILDTKIEKLQVYVLNGTIEEIIVVYPPKTRWAFITASAAEYYGSANYVKKSNGETGTCLWNGNEYALEVSNAGKTYIKATFRRAVK